MSLERRLQEHLHDTGAQLPDPGGDLDRVVRRGRLRRVLTHGAMGVSAVAVVLGGAAGLRSVTMTRVAFEPAPSPSAATASPAPAATPTAAATDTPSPTGDPSAVPTVAVADLGGPVLAYSSGGPRLTLHRDGQQRRVWSGRIESVTGDGGGGVVVQSDHRLVWIADVDAPEPVTVVESDAFMTLRAALPDGRVLYSTVANGATEEDRVEHYFAVPLAAAWSAGRLTPSGAEPELITTEGAFETWMVGPAATADGQLVMASCHMMCSLYRWPDEDDTAPFAEPVYNGGGGSRTEGPTAAIEEIDATPDGRVIALAEFVPAEGVAPPAVVLLDGASFSELTRVPLPVGSVSFLTVSVSDDGQRVLATVHPYAAAPEGGEGIALPSRTFLIEDALSPAPRLSEVDFHGVLRWLDG